MTQAQTDTLNRIYAATSVEHRRLIADYISIQALCNRDDALDRLRRGEYTDAKIHLRVHDELLEIADKLTS